MSLCKKISQKAEGFVAVVSSGALNEDLYEKKGVGKLLRGSLP